MASISCVIFRRAIIFEHESWSIFPRVFKFAPLQQNFGTNQEKQFGNKSRKKFSKLWNKNFTIYCLIRIGKKYGINMKANIASAWECHWAYDCVSSIQGKTCGTITTTTNRTGEGKSTKHDNCANVILLIQHLELVKLRLLNHLFIWLDQKKLASYGIWIFWCSTFRLLVSIFVSFKTIGDSMISIILSNTQMVQAHTLQTNIVTNEAVTQILIANSSVRTQLWVVSIVLARLCECRCSAQL